MKIRRRRNYLKVILGFGVVAAGVFFGMQYVTKTGFFKVPGVVKYDESELSSEQLEAIKRIFTDEVILDKDVTISVRNSVTYPELEEGEYIYSISVPVTSFEDERVDRNEFDEIETIPIEELDSTKKLLAIDGEYYLDTFDEGAYYQVISFKSEKFEEEIRPLVEKDFKKDFPTKETVLSFAQTGVTAMSRGMNRKLAEIGGDAEFFSAEIKDFLSGFDLTHTSNEASFSEYASSENICSDTRFMNTLVDIGLDIVELTGNHNQDCGDEAAENTIDMYGDYNIRVVGGGKTAEEASRPLEIREKDTNITLLAYNLSTGGSTLDDTPGANQYSEENAVAEIAAAKERGDFVIVDVQYYECSAYASEYEDVTCDAADSAAGDQVGFFRHLIDLGADIVVGTSAHQPQTFEQYGNGAIYYGLGNLFFDQSWWPGTTRSLVLGHYFYRGKLLQTRITPTVYDDNYQPKMMPDSEWYIKRLLSVQPQ